MNISKELLSEVLNVNVQTEIHEDDWCSDNTLIYWEFDDYHNDYKNINIYELAHNCKLWALSKGYMMKIENHYSNSIQIQIRKTMANSTYKEPWKKTFKNEPEAIFKACQWILDNNKEGN